ncbi:rhomboid family intramembrane serine protease [Sphingobacterium sp. SGG-5]|uniref:rhomboid family intramembrane serine protease n=1 Tax=Sphingobacterium sp. SGG-5 TaxID=2710881 RepID=UPI0013EA2646|nr:rhomboid family intramembrane serine protease [Sphingobacterium sp. SGG-5]NGM60724.1 rhomboid family intramembrane serine protease [Sphingobacterium sp. SGG-5]
MRENVVKSFLRDTYQTSSPIPFIITGQVVLFVLIHLFELIAFAEITDKNLFSFFFGQLSLPGSFVTFVQQPWSILTHPFIYAGIFDILFDCLWLYWIGNMFLNFLNRRQFWFVFGGGLLGGAIFYLLMGQLGTLSSGAYWNTTAFGLAALISGIAILVPTLEVRLFIFGNVKFRTIALVYLALELLFTGLQNTQAIVPYMAMIIFGVVFMHQLKNGKDWSMILQVKKRRKLQVIHKKEEQGSTFRRKHPYDLPNQEEIDQILDKISQSGYDNLTSREKEILFRASKQEE